MYKIANFNISINSASLDFNDDIKKANFFLIAEQENIDATLSFHTLQEFP